MNEERLLVKILEKKCESLKKEVEYYKNIAEETGKRRLREVEQLNRLIVERKESEKTLREREQLFRLIAQSTNDIFYMVDVERGVLQWLGDIDGALGYEKGEFKHDLDDWLRMIHPQDRRAVDALVSRHKESIQPIHYAYRIISKEGSVRFWNGTSSPVLIQDGKPKKWVGGISDTTERKKAEEALIQAQRLSAIGELASGVAHDFNNALQGIFGNVELALLQKELTGTRHYLEIIKQSATDATSRIFQLQRFSGKGRGQDNYEHVDLNNLVDTVVFQTRPLWKDESEKAGISIAVKKNYVKKDLSVDVNAGELRSVLYNLVKNSVQAMPAGGKLTFETGETEKGVYVTVTDTGTGMEEETKARIFQPFFTTKGFAQGKGLGLSTSYAIIKEHGGELYVKESTPGKGTSIAIRLPHAKRQDNVLKDAVYSGHTGSAKVLWVDDEKLIRDTGEKLLTTLNHSVDVAANGEEGLHLLKNNRYDLMITDVGMPEMSGWQLAEKIKGNYPEMKIAVVTGWGADVPHEKKIKYGVDYVLGKPILLQQLQNLVGEVLQFKEKRNFTN